MNADTIIEMLLSNKTQLKKYSVRKIGLFGSFLHGDESDNSDIDFLVEFFEKSFDNYMDLKFFLEELFKRPVDLVTHKALKRQLRDKILGEVMYVEGI